MQTINVLVGSLIRDIRKSQKISQEELGARTGLNYKFIGSIERGQRNPSIATVSKLARGLHTNIQNLFHYRPDSLSKKDRLKNEIIGLLGDKTEDELKLFCRLVKLCLKNEVNFSKINGLRFIPR